MGCSDYGRQGSTQATSSVVVLELCTEQTFIATSAPGGVGDEYVIGSGEIARLGPAIQDIVVHAEGSNFTADFTYRVDLQFRYRNGPWQTANLLATRTTEGYVISAPFTDRSKMGMNIRIVLVTLIDTGGSGTQRGDLNISVALRLFCS